MIKTKEQVLEKCKVLTCENPQEIKWKKYLICKSCLNSIKELEEKTNAITKFFLRKTKKVEEALSEEKKIGE